MAKDWESKAAQEALFQGSLIPGGLQPSSHSQSAADAQVQRDRMTREACSTYRNVIREFAELDSWPAVEKELGTALPHLKDPGGAARVAEIINAARSAFTNDVVHSTVQYRNIQAKDPKSFLLYVQEFLSDPRVYRSIVQAACPTEGEVSQDEADAIMRALVKGFGSTVHETSQDAGAVPREFRRFRKAVKELRGNIGLQLSSLFPEPGHPASTGDLTTAADLQDAPRVERLDTSSQVQRARRAEGPTSASEPERDAPRTVPEASLSLPSRPLEPGVIEAELELRFRGYASAHPDQAKEFAYRLVQISEEFGGARHERTLGLREAARRISKAKGVDLHSTQLLRYFRDSSIEIGAPGLDGGPRFSEHECDNFVPPQRPRGRPPKKLNLPS